MYQNKTIVSNVEQSLGGANDREAAPVLLEKIQHRINFNITTAHYTMWLFGQLTK